MGSHTRTSIVQLSWKMLNHFFRWEFAKEQHVRKNSPFRATEAGLFSNVVYVYGHQIFRQLRRSKTVLFQIEFGKDFFNKKFNLNLRRTFRLEFAKE